MSDDGYSATELRKRYHRNGSANDSDLSAAQLRSRYDIPPNKIHDPLELPKDPILIAVAIVIFLIAIASIAYFLSFAEQETKISV